jgi:carbamoyltransferase
MKILGINSFHADSSACIIIDGKIIAAVEEERFVRIKHYKGFPVLSINFCLNYCGLKIEDIDYIAVNHNPNYNLHKKIFFGILHLLNIRFWYSKFRNLSKKKSIKLNLYKFFGCTKNIKIQYIPHHLSHIASSVLCSGISNGLAISYDGSGDFSTFEAYSVKENNIKIIKKINFPHSLGIFYQSFTQFLGFHEYGDEYKFMGLSAYGKNQYVNKVRNLISSKNGSFQLNLKYFSHQSSIDESEFSSLSPFNDRLYSYKFINLFGKPRGKNEIISSRHKNIAYSVQFVFEESLIRLINYYKKKTKAQNLYLSGGCALNSLANMKIINNIDFQKVFIQPNAGDAGGALGAALYVSQLRDKNFVNKKISNMYLGIKESNKEIKRTLDKYFLKNSKFIYTKYSNINKLCKVVAIKIKNNNVIAWHQGRAEFGPRALGNRSILANPSDIKIKNIINKKIKLRELFRPFAPSVIDKFADKFFNLKNNFDYTYMNAVCTVKKKMEKVIPAVLNIDNTARIHVVKKKDNSAYYKLLNYFYKLTKIPVLLNTSLNINEPISNISEDTVKTFLNSRIDVLVVENYLIIRKQ